MNALNTYKKPLITVSAVTGVILSVPLIAMQFSSEVMWTGSDFLFAGLLLFGTGSAYIIIRQKMDNSLYKIATGLGLASTLFMIWANGAVGLIGNENDPVNLAYFGVVLVGFMGTMLSGLKPKGLSYTFIAMTVSVLIIMIYALMTGMQYDPGSSLSEIVLVNGLFAVLFCTTSMLYHRVDQNLDS